MARGIHGLPEGSPGPAQPNPFTPCGPVASGRWRSPCGRLLPPWIPHAIRIWQRMHRWGGKLHGKQKEKTKGGKREKNPGNLDDIRNVKQIVPKNDCTKKKLTTRKRQETSLHKKSLATSGKMSGPRENPNLDVFFLIYDFSWG
jgi:hypothetical protein